MPFKVVIEFPDAMARERFLGWLSDGGGEYNFFEYEDCHAGEDGTPSIKGMGYDKAFPAWGYDPMKDGPDKTVVARY